MKYTIQLLLILSFLLSSCCRKVVSLPPSENKIIQETIVQMDTTIQVVADTSYYQAYITCKNNKPILLKDTVYKNRKTSFLQTPKVVLANNKLTVNCERKAQVIFLEWKEKYIKENKTITQPVYIPYPLKWWQTALMYLGGILIIGIVITLIKPKF